MDSWERLLNDHLPWSVINGAALLSSNGEVFHCLGLQSDQDWSSIKGLFCQSSHLDLNQLRLTLRTSADIERSFVIFQKTEYSSYGISEGNQDGLVVCSLPWGIMVCTTVGSPVAMNTAIPAVEALADKLRH